MNLSRASISFQLSRGQNQLTILIAVLFLTMTICSYFWFGPSVCILVSLVTAIILLTNIKGFLQLRKFKTSFNGQRNLDDENRYVYLLSEIQDLKKQVSSIKN